MNLFLLILALVMVAFVARQFIAARPGLAPAAAQTALHDGSAVLVDVREAPEWADGVLKGAALLPLSDLRSGRRSWRPFLEKSQGKRILLYCHSGTRSGMAASTLRGEGFDAVNLGSFGGLVRGGLPVRKP
ncbi:MAG: rhodanese-like domain-containing protein [Opitutaceae bacterium]|nr:rhodanese-like domain-containing protein [Opitutaceae bacterium]